jgi:hypothetical protein
MFRLTNAGADAAGMSGPQRGAAPVLSGPCAPIAAIAAIRSDRKIRPKQTFKSGQIWPAESAIVEVGEQRPALISSVWEWREARAVPCAPSVREVPRPSRNLLSSTPKTQKMGRSGSRSTGRSTKRAGSTGAAHGLFAMRRS